jgi:hypothetical protein
MPTQQTETLTITIDLPVGAVVDDLADPVNHPEWATEFFSGPARPGVDGVVEVDVPMMGGPGSRHSQWHGLRCALDPCPSVEPARRRLAGGTKRHGQGVGRLA